MEWKELPSRPSLEQYKKQAKDLLKSHKSGDREALSRIERHHPRFGSAKFALADAQLVVAREHGFESWPQFAKQLEAREREGSEVFIWKAAEDAVIAGDAAGLERLLQEHERLFREGQPPSFGFGGLRADYSGGDARSILARNHHFESWAKFEEHVEARGRKNSAMEQFEAAVDAVIGGDVAQLEGLLGKNPDLVRVRSTRTHGATLLHYVGANGVEYFRQKTPKNAVAIAETLLKAGAEAGAVAEMYGGSTALDLVATSVHPLRAVVQNALIGTLLKNGAAAGDGAVDGCLANGREEAAEFLAQRGAKLDLASAAGVGRLDLVKEFFDEGAEEQVKRGFGWACQYGRASIVEFLLQKGFDVGAKLKRHGETGLHHAALGGHSDVVQLLLERKAPVGVKDETWGGTALGWALHAWSNRPPGTASGSHDRVAKLLVAAGSRVEAEWLESESVRADPRMLAALRGDST